ncbi:MAG TPA: hypothetical protein VN200_11750, partial [Rhodoglobus sp.]|nr:hypothetical protein [Rhodoglobus sp.]
MRPDEPTEPVSPADEPTQAIPMDAPTRPLDGPVPDAAVRAPGLADHVPIAQPAPATELLTAAPERRGAPGWLVPAAITAVILTGAVVGGVIVFQGLQPPTAVAPTPT